MLLVSDREGVQASPPSGFLHLGRPLGLVPLDLPPFDRIVCDVALDDLASVEALRAALAVLRPCLDMPLHVVLREDTMFARAIANAFGATTIVPAHDPAAKFVLSDVAEITCQTSTDEIRPDVGPFSVADDASDEPVDPTADIGALAASLARIFAAAADRRPFSADDLELGVSSLLRSVRRSEIGRWVEVVRRYDDATYQHCLLVAGLTAAFAVKLGLSTGRQRMLAQAAILHDIGKAKVPLAVLNKAGPLNATELAAMRRHPVDGYYMLDRQPGLFAGVREVVRDHHEMLDGTGYPEGLRKARIGEAVRIVTICDIGAALVEQRPYRAPSSGEEAFATLREMGEKLDTGLVLAFETVLKAGAAAAPRAA